MDKIERSAAYTTHRNLHPIDNREQLISEWFVPLVVGITLIVFVLVPAAVLLGH